LIIDKNKKPGIEFDSVILQKLNFNRDVSTVHPKMDLKVEFNISSTVNSDKTKATILLEVTIKDSEQSNFFIDCKMVGNFSVIQGDENLDLNQFLNINAPALIFPYVRETISNITMRAGIKPIILPPINMHLVKKSTNNK